LKEGEAGNSSELVQLANLLVDEGQNQNLVLRASAGVGFKMHCNGIAQKYAVLNRSLHDIDFVGRSQNLRKITGVMESQGFVKVPTSLNAAFSSREIYYHPKARVEVDVFLDRLQMNHTIELKDRLELDSPTITISDLLLQKLQIVQLNMKDLTDLIMLLSEHDLGKTEKEEVNLPYIAKILSEDWGFYYTACMNLQKIVGQLPQVDGLDGWIVEEVSKKTSGILESVERHPKSLGWRLRAKVGTSKRWYREVEREAPLVVASGDQPPSTN
jgi:hypothetical protein